jgi:hypothetical protein
MRVALPVVVVATTIGVYALRPERISVVGEIPDALADTTFWRMMSDMSEANGYFRSDNFVSNEAAFQYVIPDLQRRVRARGVYLGVGPDQNFTYIVAFRPRIAFIVDIRRQNAMHHLMYKALIELSADRADFLSRLFSRPRPPGLDTNSSASALLTSYAAMPAVGEVRDTNMELITRHLRVTHGFPITDEDLASVEYVLGAFYESGPDLSYSSSQRFVRGPPRGPPRGSSRESSRGPSRGPSTGGFGRPGLFGSVFGRGMPSYAWLMEETDAAGVQRSYLATEDNFRALKEMERRNLIVPLVGDFAGDKALRSVGRWLREHDATVSFFYTSNVEQYLYQQGDDWSRFYKNVATLPIDSTSTFIRSVSNRLAARAQNPNSRMVQLVLPIGELLGAFRARKVRSYNELVAMSR